MSVGLLWPLGLLALAALAMPLILHLQRREMRRITRFAALRWLAGPTQAQSSLRLERPWLLLLRLLLLSLLAVLLAQPLLRGDWRSARDWVLVVPGVDLGAARQALSAPAADWRWLAPGFPRVDKSIVATAGRTASLLRELDTDLPAATTLSVIAPAQLDGLDGERIVLSRPIRWTILPAAPTQTRTVADAAPAVQLAVRYDASSAAALRYVRAAVQAWNVLEPDRYRIDIQASDQPLDERSAWLLWLAAETPAAIDAWIERGGVAVLGAGATPLPAVVWQDATGQVFARGRLQGKGRRIELTMPWQASQWPLLLDARFPRDLLALYRGAAPAPDRAITTAALSRSGAVRATPADLALDTPLAVLLALLFLIERYVATRRPRSLA